MNSNKTIFKTRPYLAIAAIVHCTQAALLYLGYHYHTQAAREAIMIGFPKLIQIDQVTAVALVVAALLQFLAMALIKKRSSSVLLIFAYLLLLIGTIGSGIGRSVITGLSPLTLSTVLQAVLYVLLLAVHIKLLCTPVASEEQATSASNQQETTTLEAKIGELDSASAESSHDQIG